MREVVKNKNFTIRLTVRIDPPCLSLLYALRVTASPNCRQRFFLAILTSFPWILLKYILPVAASLTKRIFVLLQTKRTLPQTPSAGSVLFANKYSLFKTTTLICLELILHKSWTFTDHFNSFSGFRSIWDTFAVAASWLLGHWPSR